MKPNESLAMTQNVQNGQVPSTSSLPGHTAPAGKRLEPARFEELPSFTLAGISVVTTNAAELSGSGKIAALFEQFYLQNVAGKLADHQQQPGLYSCYFDYEQGDAGHYEVMVSVRVREALQVDGPAAVKTFTVPAAKYAVFVTERGAVIEMVQRAWADIWQWSRQPGNERAFTGDFEYYGPDTDPNDGQAEIYIAVR
ncbi:Predicted transcriptional regulator YdeE, contains AraC-type DNA-binding domain [Paenibacillus sp. UNCCL117]|uniref:GyrI-like domain-containing protein n=1 Tax=unclassified Paenibacillus TaxID=185978 RepID=UPI0008804FBA|nr:MULTISPECIES: GyrI-like domain-containing protein [unclassified Paenibacillus]SDD50644.1 Predicted transcriptional regulator YdeE, contains AraC-type DNA-binding domain [Paenibacillus sp. cl123]SFW49689.1 Predicted transcriptional regulator YdeE, contains AraC-type DNA-binding domain [Paenibacillus sp. UNCCL117]